MSFKSVITDVASGQTKAKFQDATERFKEGLVAPIYKIPFGIGSTLKEIKDKRDGTFMKNVGTDRPVEETLQSLLDAEIKVKEELSGLNKTLGDIKNILQNQASTFDELLDDSAKHEDISKNETTKLSSDATTKLGNDSKSDGWITKIEKIGEAFLGLEGIADVIGVVGGAGLLGTLAAASVAVATFGGAVYGIKKLIDWAFPNANRHGTGADFSPATVAGDLDPSTFKAPSAGVKPYSETHKDKPWKTGADFSPTAVAGDLDPSTFDAVPNSRTDFIARNEDNKTKGDTFNEYVDKGASGPKRAIGFGHDLTEAEKESGKIIIDGEEVYVGKGNDNQHATITRTQAKKLLDQDYSIAETGAKDTIGEKDWSKLSENSKTAIVDYTYNHGVNGASRKLNAIAGAIESVDATPETIAKSVAEILSGGTGDPKRLVREANLARTPDREASFGAPPGLLDIKHPDAEYVPPKVDMGKKFHEMSKEKTEASHTPIVIPVPTGGSSGGGGPIPIPVGGSSGPTVALGSSAPPNSVDINSMG